MTDLAYSGWPATLRRLSLALVASASGHAVVLANAALAPGVSEVALFTQGQPLTARLMPAPAEQRAPDALPQPVASGPGAGLTTAAAQNAEPPASAAGLPSEEIYFPGSDLDERAVPLNDANVIYPESALALQVSGSVTLRLLIDHTGVLRDASVVESQPAGVFDNAALLAVRALRFRPAIRKGAAVGSVKIIEVPFDPDCKRTGSCIE